MKKFLFFGAVAAMLLGTASCSSDMEPAMGGETPVSFSINLGDNIDSRTISDGTGANTLKFAVFENGAEITGLAQEVPVTNKQATINTKLVKGHTYSFVFWAQNSACTAYNTTNMSAIKVDYAANCNDETRDAFYKMDEFQVTEAFEKTEVLTRPFAQINFLADDAAGVVGVDTYKSKVTVTGVPTTLNTLDGSVSDTTSVTFDYATIVAATEELQGYEDYRYVAMNYILAASTKEIKNQVVLTVKDNGNQEVNTVTVANCPVQRNYRTNIFGDLFTVNGKFNIVIDPIYNTPDYNINIFSVTSTEEFMAALNYINSSSEGGVIKVDGNVDLSNEADKIYISNKLHLILNGRLTTQKGNQVCVIPGGDVTVEGEGTYETNRGLFQVLGGKVTVESGNFKTQNNTRGSGIYSDDTYGTNSEITINGGYFDCAFYGVWNNGSGKVVINDGVIKSSAMMSVGTWAYTVRSSGTLIINGGWIDGIHGALAVDAGNAIINNGYLTTHDYYENGVAKGQNHYAVFVGNAESTDAGSVTIHGGYFYVEPTRSLPCIYNDGADGLSALPVTVYSGYFNNLGLNNFLADQGVTALSEPIQDSEHNATYSYGKQSISGTGENPGNTPGPDPDIPMP